MMSEESRVWPPISGDFIVKNPQGCVAICTLGKRLDVPGNYAIIGTCKTENIGIERVIVNIVSNPMIRFFILAGPEVPGHLTGSSLKSLYEQGVETETRKIIGAPGAIPYIENIPLDAVERFRMQVDFIDMMNSSNLEKISAKAEELESKNPGPLEQSALWIEFKSSSTRAQVKGLAAQVILLPEYGLSFNPHLSLV
ncbi:MAG: tetrahydromethanopterin S-methyltransferase subunit A, partial [Candidatus Hodarchaeota archaeon]